VRVVPRTCATRERDELHERPPRLAPCSRSAWRARVEPLELAVRAERNDEPPPCSPRKEPGELWRERCEAREAREEERDEAREAREEEQSSSSERGAREPDVEPVYVTEPV